MRSHPVELTLSLDQGTMQVKQQRLSTLSRLLHTDHLSERLDSKSPALSFRGFIPEDPMRGYFFT